MMKEDEEDHFMVQKFLERSTSKICNPGGGGESSSEEPSTAWRVAAPIRIPLDLVNGNQLRYTSASRIFDHHLYTNSDSFFDPNEHEVFVVSQIVQTLPVPHLEAIVRKSRGNLSAIVSDMWVERVGKTTFALGFCIRLSNSAPVIHRHHHASINDDNNHRVLALAQRLHVRRHKRTLQMVTVTPHQRETWRYERPHGLPGTSAFWSATKSQASILSPLSSRSGGKGGVCVLHAPFTNDNDNMSTCTTTAVRLGPQHCSMDHVDNSALADICIQTLYMELFRRGSYGSLWKQRQPPSPARLEELVECLHLEYMDSTPARGCELVCHVVEEGKKENTIGTKYRVWLTSSPSSGGTPKALVVATFIMIK